MKEAVMLLEQVVSFFPNNILYQLVCLHDNDSKANDLIWSIIWSYVSFLALALSHTDYSGIVKKQTIKIIWTHFKLKIGFLRLLML